MLRVLLVYALENVGTRAEDERLQHRANNAHERKIDPLGLVNSFAASEEVTARLVQIEHVYPLGIIEIKPIYIM